MSPRAGTALSPEFSELSIIIRGTKFRIRELSIGEYDDLVKKATKTQQNALGEEVENIDNTLLLRLMVLKSVIEPKLTPDVMASMPMRVVLKLNQTVNQLHYGDEPELSVVPGEEGEEEDQGNASTPAT